MPSSSVYPLDLDFQHTQGAIAAYLIPHRRGAVLIESGPGSTLPGLKKALAEHHLNFGDISDVFLTHIHLDHAGAAGFLSQQGAVVHVHPVGAPHMINPEKLLRSAGRIYGEKMGPLWGEFLPVAEDHLHITQDGETIAVENLRIQVLETPGHAWHHNAYLFEGVCFSGDVGGVRLQSGPPHLRLPMPPPEFHLETWRKTLSAMRQLDIRTIAPTHFGMFHDPHRHFDMIAKALDDAEIWMETVMPDNPKIEDLRPQFVAWAREKSLQAGVAPEVIDALEISNPSGMSADGLLRYWQKNRVQP